MHISLWAGGGVPHSVAKGGIPPCWQIKKKTYFPYLAVISVKTDHILSTKILKFVSWKRNPDHTLELPPQSNTSVETLSRVDPLFIDKKLYVYVDKIPMCTCDILFLVNNLQYCREPPWPRGSVLGFSMEDSIISFISPSSWDYPGPAEPTCAQRWPETPFISFQ